MSQEMVKAKTVHVEDILIAYQQLKDIVAHTPLQKNERLSEKYQCNVYLKREDLQFVRSFKLRGAYYKIKSIENVAREKGVICASAGNHAQGVAYTCRDLGIHGKIFMPQTTPKQKIDQVKMFGREFVEVVLTGDTFDDSSASAFKCADQEGRVFIHPFDDENVIAGQGTVAVEILNDVEEAPDYVFASIGGGGLMSGISTYIKSVTPLTKLIGVEPSGASSMKASIQNGAVHSLSHIDKFVDGAAVKCVGQKTFEICNRLVDDIIPVPEGKVCTAILELYNEHAIVAEPAGALPIAALDYYKDQIKGNPSFVLLVEEITILAECKKSKKNHLFMKGYFITLS
ncbi:threonine ammonia-lyase IlvA [Heyndrickxia vini]|uniref:threonine ammonia-lyase IlvA n=1 Tax=Heyndrickxia vini TaxID=1476025 RepID=UPI001FE90BF1|nr:threonine ammonia-lyase IlvA [Heyndrickxia vini]